MTALVFLAAFALYLPASYPWLAPRDAGDLVLAASTLGVAHAPGYPLHALLGRAVETLVAFGHPAWRLSLLSCLAAGAAATAFVLARRRGGVWGGLAAAAAFALSAPLWKFALLQEKYALHALFCAALLALAQGERATAFGRARLSGLLIGLGLVNHQSLLFWLPAPLLLWRLEARRHGASLGRLAAAALPWAGAGLALTLYTALRGEPGAFWDTVLRRRYGTVSLFAGYQRPFADAAPGLLGHFARGLAAPAALFAALGAWRAVREDAARAAALLSGALGAVVFLLLTRFDATGWAARSALEPAFLTPALVLAVLAGEGVAAMPRGAAALPLAVLLACGAWSPAPTHRRDFLAYDYARDLRRAVPPGAALLASGDTASFTLRYDALREPLGFELGDAGVLADPRGWAAARRGRLYTTGMGLETLAALGVDAAPAGLVQAAAPAAPLPPVLALRRERDWARSDSYSKDVLLSYAFASYLGARLEEAKGRSAGPGPDLLAVLLDPEDYRWE